MNSARQSACFPLLPYSNRIAQAELVWLGERYPLRPRFDNEPHSLHGVGWLHAWQVVERSRDQVTLRYLHEPDAGWPFAFVATQAFELRDDGLRMTLQFENQEAHAAPAGLGWHPYFVKHPRTRLLFRAKEMWETGADQLPTAAVVHAGLDANCSQLAVNNCFGGWTGDALLRDDAVQTELRSDLPFLLVSTNPGKDFVAVEPVSHVPNRGLQALEPGAVAQAAMHIAARRAA